MAHNAANKAYTGTRAVSVPAASQMSRGRGGAGAALKEALATASRKAFLARSYAAVFSGQTAEGGRNWKSNPTSAGSPSAASQSV
jgi:hypothetical protein